jgi:hypothetical protein
MWSALDDIVHHKRRYSRSDLERKLHRNGFDLLFASSFVTLLFPAMAASRLLSRARKRSSDRKEAFTSEVVLPPTVNRVCDWVMRADEAMVGAGVSLPFGGSLLAVARKS